MKIELRTSEYIVIMDFHLNFGINHASIDLKLPNEKVEWFEEHGIEYTLQKKYPNVSEMTFETVYLKFTSKEDCLLYQMRWT